VQPAQPVGLPQPISEPKVNELIISGDIPRIDPVTGELGELGARPFSEAPEPAGALQRALEGIGKTGFQGLATGAAAGARGLVGVADLPANVINLASGLVGGEGVVPVIAGTEFGQAAITSPVPEADRNLVISSLEKATEFYGGGLAFAKIFQAATATNPVTLQSSTGRLASEQLAKFNAPVERAAAAGAGIAGAVAEEVSDSPTVKASFEIGGALLGGGSAAFKQRGGVTAQRAAKAIQEKASFRDQALKSVQDSREGIAGVEAANDQGIMSLYQDIIRTDHSLEQKYAEYVKEASDIMQRELSEILGTGGRVEEGVMQDFIARNKAVLIDMIDQRVAQAENIIRETQSLGGRSINDVEQSKIIDREVNAAIDDIGNQNRILWEAVGDDNITSIPVQGIQEVARGIVEGFTKTSRPSAGLKSQLETVLGKRIIKTKKGFEISDKPHDEAQFLTNETAGEVIKARGTWEALKREAQTGTSGNTEDARSYIILSEAALDTLQNSSGVGAAYDTARDFTRRFKELTTQGRLGSSSRRTAQGDVRVPPERAGQVLFGGERAGAAVGAREVTELTALQTEARQAQALPPSSGVEQASGNFLLTQFQRKSREGAEAAARWAEDHETALKAFPDMKQVVNDAVNTLVSREGRLSVLGSRKAKVEADAFFQVAGMNGKRAISHLLNDPTPTKTINNFLRRLQGGQDFSNPSDAMTGFKNSVADFALNSFSTPTKGASFSKASQVLARLKPILNSKAYTRKDRDAISTMLKELETRTKLITERGVGVPLKPNMFTNLAGRWIGARILTSFATGAGNIILAGVGAREGGRIFTELSDRAVNDLMSAAMLDKKLLERMLKLDTSKAASRVEAIRIVASVNAAAAQELEQQQQQEPQ